MSRMDSFSDEYIGDEPPDCPEEFFKRDFPELK